MYFVYILKSQKNGRLYTGSTNNLNDRLRRHNAGESKATRHTRPFDLLYYESFLSRTEAVRRERCFKTGKGREELAELLVRRIGA